jgi:hypothetical protein
MVRALENQPGQKNEKEKGIKALLQGSRTNWNLGS